jgi:hypothetical protein
MIRSYLAVLTISATTFVAYSDSSIAGPFTDDMARCLVRATSESDRVDLVRWIVATIAIHPGVKGMTGISANRRSSETKHAANLVEELLTVRCRNESKDAVQFEGESAFEAAFSILGEVAMKSLMSDPTVVAEMAKLGEYLDEAKLISIFKER